MADPVSSSLQRTTASSRFPLHELVPNSYHSSSRHGSTASVLSSFSDLRRKTLNLLYNGRDPAHARESEADGSPSAKDKSPKGSVDILIRPLIDLINHHPDYASLSSCSGRISIFNPNAEHASPSTGTTGTDTSGEAASKPVKEVESGKGSGRWWLVSHDPILDNPDAIIDCLNAHAVDQNASNRRRSTSPSTKGVNDKPVVFKVEPMLLHVTASTVQRAQDLLQVALSCGFRESGLVVTPTKVTVAVRGYSLAMTVPIAVDGPLRPPDLYLRSLLDVANQRMHRNIEQMTKLYHCLEKTLFRQVKSADREAIPNSCKYHVTDALPSLNLWGHASVCVPKAARHQSHKHLNDGHTPTKYDDIEVYVFGGYGIGPHVDTAKQRQTGSSRSSHVYRLERNGGCWMSSWTKVDVVSSNDAAPVRWMGIELYPCEFPACQGATACLLSIDDRADESTLEPPQALQQPQMEQLRQVVFIWGGRCSPTQVMDQIYLFAVPTDRKPGRFYRPAPSHVHGNAPTGRWGHTMTVLNKISESSPTVLFRCLILGGRNGEGAISDGGQLARVFSVANLGVRSGDAPGSDTRFVWETVRVDGDSVDSHLSVMKRFHHNTIEIPERRQQTEIAAECSQHSLLVCGGLVLPNAQLTRQFASDRKPAVWKCRLQRFSEAKDGGSEAPCGWVLAAEAVGSDATARFKLFGGAATVVTGPDRQVFTLLTGGCSPVSDSAADDTIQMFRMTADPTNRISTVPTSTTIDTEASVSIVDFGSLVHHTVVFDEASNEMLLLGGGAAGFAFGDIFAKSYAGKVIIDCAETGLSASHDGTDGSNDIHQPPAQITGTNSSTEAVFDSSSRRGSEGMPSPATNVIVVETRQAKLMKQRLEAGGVLDKRYRMRPYDTQTDPDGVPTKCIAIPVHSDGWKLIEGYSAMVVKTDRVEMPYSTSQYARQPKSK